MATQESLDRIQQFYIAYYGRAADPDGQLFWGERLDLAGGDLDEVIDAFGNSAEFDSRYGSLSDADLIDTIFSQTFGRLADPTGKLFYLDRLQSGEASLANIALQVLDGAINDDAIVITNKQQVADAFTSEVVATKSIYSGNSSADAAKIVLDSVTSDQSTVNTQIQAGISLISTFDKDLQAPEVVDTTPDNGDIGIDPDSNITLVFDENVKVASGEIRLIDQTDGSDSRNISISDSQVTVTLNTLIINPSTDLEAGTEYIVEIDSGALLDNVGNEFAGIDDSPGLSFLTLDTDDTKAPEILTTSPTDNEDGVPTDSVITVTFDEAIIPSFGSITLTDTDDGSDTRTIPVTDNQINFEANLLTINLSNELDKLTTYAVQINAGVITDLLGNPFAGIISPTEFNFTTASDDNDAPVISTLSPSDNASGVGINTNIVIEFNENILAGVGSILITDSDDGSGTLNIDIGDDQVSISGSTLSINLSSNLESSTNYNIQMEEGVVTDNVGNDFPGISSPGSFNFTTSSGLSFVGTPNADQFIGSSSADLFSMGLNLSQEDTINGGAGEDSLEITGAIATDLNNVSNIEVLILDDAETTITTLDSLVSAGSTLTVDGSALSAGHSLSFNGSAETDGGFQLTGGNSEDQITAGQLNDDISTGDGDDRIIFDTYLTSDDILDGGNGTDSLVVLGLDSNDLDQVINVEVIELFDADANIVTLDSLISSGAMLTIDGSLLTSGQQLIIDARAETDGNLTVQGGADQDQILAGLGDDTINTGNGDDSIVMGGNLNGADAIDGGEGTDTLSITGADANDLDNVTNIELLSLVDAATTIITLDSLVTEGATLVVDGSLLTAGNILTFEGSSESDSHFDITGGAANDIITGGQGVDSIFAGMGDDTIDMRGNLSSLDTVDGGVGTDTLTILGAISSDLDSVSNIEILILGDADTHINTNDNLVADSALLTVDASAVTVGNSVIFDGVAELDGAFTFIAGTGQDTFVGGAGNDTFEFGSNLTTSDSLFGRGGTDTLKISGADATDLDNVSGIEVLELANLTTTIIATPNLVSSDTTLLVDGSALTSGQKLTFNGAAETSGSFNIVGGDDDDTITGGQDEDIISTGLGADTIHMGQNLTNEDNIDGGGGNDTLTLSGAISTDLDNVINVEVIILADATTNISTEETLVASGQTLTIDGSALTEDQVFVFDGSAETNGNFIVSAGEDDDSLTGGNGDDQLDAGDGNDIVQGGLGIDSLTLGDGMDTVVVGAGELIESSRDLILDFVVADDVIRIDATIMNDGTGDITDGLAAGEYQESGAAGAYLLGANQIALDLGFEFDAEVSLDESLTLTELLSAAGAADNAAVGTTSATLSVTAADDQFLLIAYQNSDAFIYLLKEGDSDTTITAGGADSIELVGTYTDIAVDAFTASLFVA